MSEATDLLSATANISLGTIPALIALMLWMAALVLATVDGFCSCLALLKESQRLQGRMKALEPIQ